MAMIQKTVLFSLALFQSTGLASPVPQSNPSESKSCSPPGYGYGKKVGKAVYFITNEAENSVVALPISKDGTLSRGTITKTGGMGSNIINANSTMPNAPDALVSQSALTVVGNNIFAVNAGSNTLTMLTISPSDPTSLKILGEPVALPGTFPNTVTASMKHKLACVGTTGDKSGISCAPFSEKGLGDMDELRSFDLMQTSPPRGPPNTVSHTFFSADESMLFTTVKGNANTNSTGFFSVFAVETGDEGKTYVAKKDTRSSPAGTRTLFGSATIPENPKSFFVTDPSFGAAIMSVDENMKVSVTHNQTIPDQQAICWSTFSTATKTAFLADGGKDRITELSMEDGSVVGQVDLPQVGGQGVFDIRAGGDFVYALSAGNGSVEAAISVVDVSGGKGSLRALQHFALGGLATKNAMGMAVLV